MSSINRLFDWTWVLCVLYAGLCRCDPNHWETASISAYSSSNCSIWLACSLDIFWIDSSHQRFQLRFASSMDIRFQIQDPVYHRQLTNRPCGIQCLTLDDRIIILIGNISLDCTEALATNTLSYLQIKWTLIEKECLPFPLQPLCDFEASKRLFGTQVESLSLEYSLFLCWLLPRSRVPSKI